MKKPIIGVTPLYDSDKDSVWMLPGYLEGITAAGGIPIILPLYSSGEDLIKCARLCDGFLFTGGQDVSPGIYGEEKSEFCGEICNPRDKLETSLLGFALENDKPVLGICRGLQFINAFLGGTLYQDLDKFHPSFTCHHMEPPYDRAVHKVRINKDSPLFDIIKTEELGVNSYHHQSVKKLSDKLSCAAVSEDGLCEAAFMENKKFVLAVQWHPEFSFKSDNASLNILKALINACF